MIVLVPSRGRPARAATMVDSVRATAVDPVEILVLVDPDDPALPGYQAHDGLPLFELPEPMGYTAALNHVARLTWDRHDVLGAFGDDVVFRTLGWDDHVRHALATPGLAYGDDLIHGRNHPSAVFMSSAIAKALGWLALPVTSHQWADDGWKRLGQATGTLRYLEGVVFEHEHPGVGKAKWDDTYAGVFTVERAEADHAGFNGWVESGGLDRDALVVRQLVDGAA